MDDASLADYILAALEDTPNLTTLDLSGNKCLQQSISALCPLLDRTKLQHLDLSLQSIDSNESMNLSLLVAALGRTSTLRSIELQCNKITDQDMAYLAAALSHNTSIEYVGLSGNQITNTGISILASRVPNMMGLRTLVLTNNQFDSEGIKELSRSMEQNFTLETINIDLSSTTPEHYKQVQYYADLNWGGRWLLRQSTRQPNMPPLKPAAWPTLLQRIGFHFQTKEYGRERQANVIYCLLRNGPALFPM